MHEADACRSSSNPATPAGTDAFDLSNVLAGKSPPVPCITMPDPAAVNTGFPRHPLGYVNALRSKAPKMTLNAELAVKGECNPARAPVNTGAMHCYVSEKFIRKTALPMRQQHTWLSLASGSNVISLGKAVLPVDIHTRVLLSVLSFSCLITLISFVVKTGVKQLLVRFRSRL